MTGGGGVDTVRSVDAVVPLDPARTRFDVDLGIFFVGILREQWDSRNTDGVTPRVELAETMKGVRYEKGNDYIAIWPPEATPGDQPVGTPYLWQHETLPVTLEFVAAYRTRPTDGQFRHHMTRFRNEARRIIQGVRFDPFGEPSVAELSGRQWIKWGVRKTNPAPWASGTFRFEIGCDVEWRFREVDA